MAPAWAVLGVAYGRTTPVHRGQAPALTFGQQGARAAVRKAQWNQRFGSDDSETDSDYS